MLQSEAVRQPEGIFVFVPDALRPIDACDRLNVLKRGILGG